MLSLILGCLVLCCIVAGLIWLDARHEVEPVPYAQRDDLRRIRLQQSQLTWRPRRAYRNLL